MGIIELLMLGIGLSMDAFAVSVCKGLSTNNAGLNNSIKCGIWFGGFQALMPFIGFYLGNLFAKTIEAVDHWVAFVLLVLIGINMLKEAFSDECDCCDEKNADFSVKTMFAMAVATSIDALAVGVSLAITGNVNIWIAITIIGITTFVLSAIGVKIGNIFGSKCQSKAQIAGGIILILIGTKILIEHLNII
ncbi:MAG: manganese efflux pump [Clostridia bacterium]|nr:manganese efflux pump [Clostridia bacterium]